MTDTREASRRRFATRVGPHKQVSGVRVVAAPAQPGVPAHNDYLVTTACGREVATTLATERGDKVRCPDCLDAIRVQ